MAFSLKSAISFGLVYIPISLSLSVKNNDISFNMLDRKTKSRVKYIKTCVDCDERTVKNEDIVKGFEYEKDQYVIFTEKDFEKIKTTKDKTIDIIQFVNESEVDPIYFDKTYYVSPTGANKAFSVLAKAMQEQKKAGIAKTVLGTKEVLIMIRVNKGNMLLSTLFYSDEIQKAPEIKSSTLAKKEMDLANHLIQQMTKPLKIEKFKDEYAIKLKKAIKQKIDGNEIVARKERKQSAKVINLMEALQKSLGNVQAKAK